jgi:transcriptional regulator
MYQPRLFREDDPSRLHGLIERHSFGTLIAVLPNGEPEISHLPFVLDRNVGPRGQLRTHVARANPIWKAGIAAPAVTAVFAGPHGFVSANWYEHPEEQVPTWNYAVVHARGTPTEMDRDGLISLLDDLSTKYEGDKKNAWRASRLTTDFRDGLLRQIVGLSIEITELSGKFKLSQNRSEVDRARVLEALRRRGREDDLAMVALMERSG